MAEAQESRAMILSAPRAPLEEIVRPVPKPGPRQILVRVHACAVCRTDLHVADGDLPNPTLPLVIGHEIIGRVVAFGEGADRSVRPGLELGARVGIPWLGWTCDACRYCTTGQENLCDNARFTGYQLDGGYADHTVADARFVFPIPDSPAAWTDVHAAPLLCAGLIGHRSLRMAGEGERLGIYGFGAAAHIVAQVARYEGRRVFAFTRPGDLEAQSFARELGAVWAGGSNDLPPEELDCAIIFAPVGALVAAALRAVRKGGIVVCGGIHMSDIPSLPYSTIWGERSIRSVANLTRRDADEFFAIAPRVPVRTEVQTFPLEKANEALAALRDGKLRGAAVLTMT